MEGNRATESVWHWGPGAAFFWNFPAERLLFHQSPFSLVVSQNSAAGATRGLTTPLAHVGSPLKRAKK